MTRSYSKPAACHVEAHHLAATGAMTCPSGFPLHGRAIGCLLLRGLVRKRPTTLIGNAFVTDGDGIRVSGQEVRLAGLDAPEFDQVARHRDVYWYAHGRHVKSTLIREIGGKRVQVTVESYDKFGRSVGTVMYNNKDVGEWLVRKGHAKAMYSKRYKHIEQEARSARRGM